MISLIQVLGGNYREGVRGVSVVSHSHIYEGFIKEKVEDVRLINKVRTLSNLRKYNVEIPNKDTFHFNPNTNELRERRSFIKKSPMKRIERKNSSYSAKEDLVSLEKNKLLPDNKIILSVKIKEMLNKIVTERERAGSLINKHMRGYMVRVNFRRRLIIERIIEERTRRIVLMQKNVRKFIVKKHIEEIRNFEYVFFYNYEEGSSKERQSLRDIDENLNEGRENHNSYYPNITQNVHNFKENKEIKIKIYRGKDGGEYKLKYSKVLSLYYLPLKKQGVMRRRIKVNFIVDGNMIIDPKYEVDNDRNGHFYNIVESWMFKKRKSEKLVKKVSNQEKRSEKNKFWENIFEIKHKSFRSTNSVSDRSEQSDATIERLLGGIVNVRSNSCFKPKYELKSILKKKQWSDVFQDELISENKPEKRVSFSENVQFSY